MWALQRLLLLLLRGRHGEGRVRGLLLRPRLVCLWPQLLHAAAAGPAPDTDAAELTKPVNGMKCPLHSNVTGPSPTLLLLLAFLCSPAVAAAPQVTCVRLDNLCGVGLLRLACVCALSARLSCSFSW